MGEVTNRAGLGEDGYTQYQAESSYGVAATGSEIDLPCKEGSEFTAYPEFIENNDIVGSRVEQDPNTGVVAGEGQFVMNCYPTLIGDLITQLLGDAAGSSAVGDGAFNSYWFIPKTGVRVGKSFSFVQAMGGVLADRLTGCVIDSVTISQQAKDNLEVTFAYTLQNYTENVARETTFSFPSASTNPPFKGAHGLITAVPSGGSQVTLCADSYSITINMNHNLERYKVCSTANAGLKEQPTFQGRPTVEVSMNVDADQYITEYARAHTKWDLIFDWTHTVSQAGSTPTYHNFAVELPGCRLAPDTAQPHTMGYLNQDLTFNCNYGGTTTNSGAAIYMGEVRVTDATDRS